MRYVFAFLVVVFASGLLMSQQLKDFIKNERMLASFGAPPEIRIFGENLVTKDRIEKLLPEKKSTLWWFLHTGEISSGLSSDPLIKDASVTICDAPKWGCFAVKVQEAEPELVVELQGEFWLLGARGALMAPARSVGGWMKLREELPLVKSLTDDERSPEIMNGRLAYVSKAYSLIRREMKKEIEWLDLRPNGEIKAKLKGLPLVATFEFDPGAGDKLQDQSARLSALLSEFGERAGKISTVDLAFEKVAVVKLIEDIG